MGTGCKPPRRPLRIAHADPVQKPCTRLGCEKTPRSATHGLTRDTHLLWHGGLVAGDFGEDDRVQVLFELPDIPTDHPAAAAFGNFDGVHIGHQALLAAVRRAADRLGGPATVITFDPHPLTILRPESAPPAIDRLATRLDLLRAQAIDRVVVLRFDRELAAQSADWFAREVLAGRLHARHIVTGPDVRFGHGGLGRLALLRQVQSEVGGSIEPFGGVQLEGAIVSSSRVRQAVAAGQLEFATRLLGRPYCLQGEVVHGDARGRTIGFPTANLSVSGQVLPALGVYACLLRIDGQVLPAVTNVGVRPTFAASDVRIEAHVLDWQGDLYGRQVQLDVLARLRGEQRFAGIEALVAQIALDVLAARQVLTAWHAAGLTP